MADIWFCYCEEWKRSFKDLRWSQSKHSINVSVWLWNISWLLLTSTIQNYCHMLGVCTLNVHRRLTQVDREKQTHATVAWTGANQGLSCVLSTHAQGKTPITSLPNSWPTGLLATILSTLHPTLMPLLDESVWRSGAAGGLAAHL